MGFRFESTCGVEAVGDLRAGGVEDSRPWGGGVVYLSYAVHGENLWSRFTGSLCCLRGVLE